MTKSAPDDGAVAVERLKAVLEALLLVAAEPLNCRRAAAILEVTEAQARTCLRLLEADYRDRDSGLTVVEVAGGYRLVTRPEFDPYVAKLEPGRALPPLSTAAVETLAIAAYRQPLTRTDLEAVRGVRCEGVVATLVERGLLEEIGRKEGPGRPILYGTTRRFLEHFGLRDLAELPALPEPEKEEPEAAV